MENKLDHFTLMRFEGDSWLLKEVQSVSGETGKGYAFSNTDDMLTGVKLLIDPPTSVKGGNK